MDCNKKELEELFGNHGKGNGNHGSLRFPPRKSVARNWQETTKQRFEEETRTGRQFALSLFICREESSSRQGEHFKRRNPHGQRAFSPCRR